MKKRLLSTLLALCMVLSLLPGMALAAETSGSCGDNVTWSYKDGTLSIQGTGPMTDYDGYYTTVPWEDYCEEIHTVTISDGVTTIPDYAFSACSNLPSVTIPGSVTTIGKGAFFYSHGLKNMTIPDSVTTVGETAFSNCIELTDVTLSSNLTTIAVAMFMTCTNLKSIVIPDGVTTIDRQAFNNCSSLSSVTIPASVTTINWYAFSNCDSLSDVYYGGSESQWNAITKERNESLEGATIHYNNAASTEPEQPSTPAAPQQPSTPAAPTTGAVLSPQNLAVDGKDVACEKYNIDGSNYFKLRDLAQLLNGTGSQFDVGFDEASATVSITTGKAYKQPNGTELVVGADNSASAQPSSQAILIDGKRHSELTVYNIGGSNFFQLRQLGNVLGFEVDFDADTNTAIVRSSGIKIIEPTLDPIVIQPVKPHDAK